MFAKFCLTISMLIMENTIACKLRHTNAKMKSDYVKLLLNASR